MIVTEAQSLLSVGRPQPDQIEITHRPSPLAPSTTTVTSLSGELRHRQVTPPHPRVTARSAGPGLAVLAGATP